MGEELVKRKGIRLAIPNKGRISQPITDLIEKSGLHLESSGGRRLVTPTCDPQVEVLFARPIDIPAYVAAGAAELGITGRDMILERGADVEILLDLKMGNATLVLAVPEDSGIEKPKDLGGKKVATEFPRIVKDYFSKNRIKATIVPVGGACEATPYLGVADAVADLTSTGTTLRTHHLRIIDEIVTSGTVLIAHKKAPEEAREKIDEIGLALESVVAAQGQCYLMMNVRKEGLEKIRAILPGLGGPTVMQVASDEALVAVHAVVAEERIYQLISQLKNAGARDILVTPIERMIR